MRFLIAWGFLWNLFIKRFNNQEKIIYVEAAKGKDQLYKTPITDIYPILFAVKGLQTFRFVPSSLSPSV